MWWSLHDGETNRAMLQKAGFQIGAAEARAGDDEKWLWIEAHKETKAEGQPTKTTFLWYRSLWRSRGR